MAVATLVLTNPGALWPACAALAVALAILVWGYARTPAPQSLRLICAALKFAGIAALLACFLEPAWSGQRAKPGANLFAVVVDNSQSMTLRSKGQPSRGETLRQRLSGPDSVWRMKLGEDFTVRNYLADTRLQPTEDFRELSFEGHGSALGRSLGNLAERYRGQPLAGVLLLTDGAVPDLDHVDLTGLPPVYPVLFEDPAPLRDLSIMGTTVTQTSFEDAPVTVLAEVSSTGFAGEEIVAKLFALDSDKPDAKSKPVAEQTVAAPEDGGKVVFRFQLRPEKTGVLFYRVRVMAKKEWDAAPEASQEATLANNETIVTVDRGSGPHRVLYVCGRPNWEYKFLHRAIEGDDQTQLVGLIRIAKREAKFEFRGRAGESSNPLFRGFGNQSKDEIEQYDQPVLVRMDTQDEFELRDGFPKTPEELYKYRAIIVGDLEAAFFTPDQMSLLQRFVSERGGGFLMLGGMESFGEGGFARTAIGDMLPVYLDKPPVAPQGELHLSLTREGWLQPWARLRDNERDETSRISVLPTVDVFNQAREAKPAATVVATASDGKNVYPALVTQHFGRGRTAALLAGDFWHTGLGDEERQKDLQKAWRQIVRWLVADVPDAIELRADPEPGSESVRLRVRARDERFEPIDNAIVAFKVTPLGAAQPVSITAEASSSEPGLYEATYVPHDSNGYRVEASVAKESGAAAGLARAGWSTDLTGAEFRTIAANRSLMETLASKTGGEVLTPSQLDGWVRGLPAKHAPVTENWTRPLWHTPAMLLFTLACFIAEWGIRRWKGLA